MSIFAISDLHLSFCPAIDKPMDIYGSRWHRHAERLRENWCSIITEKDTVILPGDISWGLKLEEAVYDLDWIASLPGHKVVLKGNHDLWWSGITRLNKMYESITFLQNDYYYAEGVYICGSRGWLTPDNDDYSCEDEKIYKRELLRLRASLDKAILDMKKHEKTGHILAALHYPPVSRLSAFSGFQQIFEEYGVKRVIYGHIHGEDGFRSAVKGLHHGVEYSLVSSDYLNCVPLMLKQGQEQEVISP